MTNDLPVNLAAALNDALRQAPDEPFVQDGKIELTRGAFLALASARQGRLQPTVERGNRVIVASRRGAVFWADLLALWGLGAVAVPWDPDTGEDRLRQMAAICQPSLIIARKQTDIDVRHFTDATSTTGIDAASLTIIGQQAVAMIMFTSGSTGSPKGAVTTHQSLLGNALASVAAIGFHSDVRLLVNTPYIFTSAISHFLVSALQGLSIVCIEKPLLFQDLAEAIASYDATAFGGSPLQARWLAEDSLQSRDLSKLAWLMSSGDHLPVDTIQTLRERLPQTRIVTVYGLTEVAGRFCVLPHELVDSQAGSVGRPIQGLQLQLLDTETLRAVEQGEVGEVFAAGDYLLRGYFGDEGASGRSLTSLGFRTGDLGYLDDNGFLYLQGRRDEVFKVAGQKVSALLITQQLLGTGYFEDVAVLPRESRYGAMPCVYYTPRPEVPFDQARVMANLRETLPGTHLPIAFVEVDAIPRTGSGKVDRKAIAASSTDSKL